MNTADHEVCCPTCFEKGRESGFNAGWKEARFYGPALKPEQAREIRRKREMGVMLKVLAQEYGISVSSVSKLCRRETYFDIR